MSWSCSSCRYDGCCDVGCGGTRYKPEMIPCELCGCSRHHDEMEDVEGHPCCEDCADAMEKLLEEEKQEPDLKPCPKCGGHPILRHPFGEIWQAECLRCHHVTRAYHFRNHGFKQAVDAWNNQPETNPNQKEH